MNLFRCSCGRVCTSKPGYTNHIKHCKDAQKKPQEDINILVINEAGYLPKVKEFWANVDRIAYDMNAAFRDKNKAAAKRARIGLLVLRNGIIKLRKDLLKVMKE